jgi:hypothetical protein
MAESLRDPQKAEALRKVSGLPQFWREVAEAR